MESRSSGSREFSDMGNIPLADGTELARGDCRYGQGFAGKGHELDLVGFTAIVDVDDSSDIARNEFLVRQIGCENDTIVFADFHLPRG
jgi:hypothetical protein